MSNRNNISYHWGDNNLLITLGNRTEPRIKVLFWAELFFTAGWATIFIIEAFPLSGSIINIMTALGASLLYILAAFRFLSRVFFTEQLLLHADMLEIISRTPFSIKVRSFEWQYMGPLHYVGQEKKTDHPLMGKCYDYFGFETQEKLIHKLHNEGNLFFNYGGFSVRFGKGVYSWNAEEIVNMMQLYIGNKLLLGPEWAEMIQEHESSDN